LIILIKGKGSYGVTLGRFSRFLLAEDVQGALRLFFTNKQLEDVATLASYGVQHLSVIQVVKRLRGGGMRQSAGGVAPDP